MKQSTKKYLYSIGKTPLGWKGRVRSENSLQTVMHSVALENVDLEKKEFSYGGCNDNGKGMWSMVGGGEHFLR